MSPSKHRDPGLTVRPPKEVQDQAKATLRENGWGIREFVVACLTAVAKQPAKVLALLAEHRPPPSRRGRPPAD